MHFVTQWSHDIIQRWEGSAHAQEPGEEGGAYGEDSPAAAMWLLFLVHLLRTFMVTT